MDLQDLFYLVAIVFMLACSFLMIMTAVFLWHAKNKLNEVHQSIETKLQKISNIDIKPTELLIGVGTSLATAILSKFSSSLRFFKSFRG